MTKKLNCHNGSPAASRPALFAPTPAAKPAAVPITIEYESEEEVELIFQEADHAGMTVTDWIRSVTKAAVSKGA